MKALDLYMVSPNTSVLEAMAVMDKNAMRIAFVCDNGRVLATLSDGDVRRHILQKGSLDCPVIEIANKSYVSLNVEETDKAEKLMRQHKIQGIPILRDGIIVDVKFLFNGLKEPKKHLSVPVVIMAGGQGTRLYPYTKVLPKPLIPIGDNTITELIMDRFLEFGCNNFYMIINHKRNMIKAFFADEELPYNVKMIDEDVPLGTGGGLSLLRDEIDQTFFMTNCDILVFEDYAKILDYHNEQRNLVTLICATKSLKVPYGVIEINEGGTINEIKEKPVFSFLTNTGFYVVNPILLDRIPHNSFIHITDIIKLCIDEDLPVGMYPISDEAWSDMGQHDELEKMKRKLNL